MLARRVLSKSTKRYDRTEKFLHYQPLSSLKEYLLVPHDPRMITHCTRLGGEDWRIETVDNAGGSIALSIIGVEITFDHMYSGVNSLPR
jgi:Uma2 family endonuclease